MSKKEIILRPYQENIINETLAAVQFGSDNVVIDSPQDAFQHQQNS